MIIPTLRECIFFFIGLGSGIYSCIFKNSPGTGYGTITNTVGNITFEESKTIRDKGLFGGSFPWEGPLYINSMTYKIIDE